MFKALQLLQNIVKNKSRYSLNIIFSFFLILFLCLSCKESIKPEDSVLSNKGSTLYDASLGRETANVNDYFYDFEIK